MGMNKNEAKSFEEMVEEQASAASAPAVEPVAEAPVALAEEPTQEGDKPCDCENCDCKETPKAE